MQGSGVVGHRRRHVVSSVREHEVLAAEVQSVDCGEGPRDRASSDDREGRTRRQRRPRIDEQVERGVRELRGPADRQLPVAVADRVAPDGDVESRAATG